MRPAEQCASPLRGTIFYSPSAGADPVTQLNMDLDNPGIPASYQETYQVNGVTEGKAAADYFGHNTVSLGNGEQFTFDIHASTATHYCRFSLAMTVVDGTKTVTENVDDHGVPFQVTAVYGIKKTWSRRSPGTPRFTLAEWRHPAATTAGPGYHRPGRRPRSVCNSRPHGCRLLAPGTGPSQQAEPGLLPAAACARADFCT